jgi:transketolase
MKRELLTYSYEQGLSHIPSALSMLDYVDELFTNRLVTPEDVIVIGKPFGSQAYYLIWRELGYLDNIESLSPGLKHDEIDFVDYSEETIGNALGVASGIALTTDRLIWVNITDATLQMGNTLEAIQFIGAKCQNNILLTVDYNGSQVTGRTDDIITVDPVIQMLSLYGWDVHYDSLDNFKISDKPSAFIINTVKGDGVDTMQRDEKKWHYKKIETLKELQSLVVELQVI